MRRLAIGLVAATALGGCSGPPSLSVDDAWVRLAAVRGAPAAGYFTIHGGPADATLIAASCDVAIRTEMHRSTTDGRGVAAMAPLASVAVPAGTDVPFSPGGRHLMLFHMNPGIVPGRTVLLTLSFADGSRIQRKAAVVAAGNAAPE